MANAYRVEDIYLFDPQAEGRNPELEGAITETYWLSNNLDHPILTNCTNYAEACVFGFYEPK